MKYLLFIMYLVSIVAGVWAIDFFGVVQVLPGIYAPAAVYVVGATLVIRDLLQNATGLRTVSVAILLGALLAALVNPGLAIASGAAFLLAELLDLAVYTPVRNKYGTVRGMLASNAVSIPVDSVIFLALAFGSQEFFTGQVIGKAFGTLVAVLVFAIIRRIRAA